MNLQTNTTPKTSSQKKKKQTYTVRWNGGWQVLSHLPTPPIFSPSWGDWFLVGLGRKHPSPIKIISLFASQPNNQNYHDT